MLFHHIRLRLLQTFLKRSVAHPVDPENIFVARTELGEIHV